jgi:hypothetical protein
MPDIGGTFDPTTVEPQKAFEPVPRGDYDVMVLETSVVPTKAGDGSMLNVELEIQNGPFARRKVFDRINLANKSVTAQEIGQKQLSGLCHAVGWLKPLTDSDVLHGKTCRARIGIEKGDGTYQDKNKVSAYINPNSGPSSGAPSQPRPQEPERPRAVAASGGSKRPW